MPDINEKVAEYLCKLQNFTEEMIQKQSFSDEDLTILINIFKAIENDSY